VAPAPPPPPPVPPTGPQQVWQQPAFNQSPYQSRANPAHVGIPYAYGQLPVNVNPNDPKSQHPIPGSYAGNFQRHGFNPKTQSFVPTTGIPPPMQAPAGPYPAALGPMHGAAANQPQMPFNGYQQPMPHPQPYAAAHGPDYSMMRQGSNNSIPPYPPPPAHQPVYPPGPSQSHPHAHQHLPPNPPPHLPNKPAMPQGAPPMGGGGCVGSHSGGNNGGQQQPYGRLPNYGNPATLPQKPST